MQKRLLLDSQLLQITIQRLCQHLIENHNDFSSSVILGLQPRGVFLANRIQKVIQELEDFMISSDISLSLTEKIINNIKNKMFIVYLAYMQIMAYPRKQDFATKTIKKKHIYIYIYISVELFSLLIFRTSP